MVCPELSHNNFAQSISGLPSKGLLRSAGGGVSDICSSYNPERIPSPKNSKESPTTDNQV